jgi:lysine 2,3-aminomutase
MFRDQLNSTILKIASGNAYYVQDSDAITTSPDQLPDALCPNPDLLARAAELFPIRINSHLLSLMDTPDGPLARQFIPSPQELCDPSGSCDPLNETGQSPTPLVIHRYPGRVIFVVSTRCAAHCRFCMRKRHQSTGAKVDASALAGGFTYIQRNRQINEVILSGGDPFMLDDASLLDILAALRALPHLRVLRIHTRIPIVWPQRITSSLIKRLARMHPLYINLHINHPREITPETTRALHLMADAGIPLGSQTVLLNNVNDSVSVLGPLFEGLLENRVRPYYLHQVDRVTGTAHYQVPVEKGLSLMRRLQGHLSGMAMPRFMIDLPGGGGKIELLPNYIIQKQAHRWEVVNFNGQRFTYNPTQTTSSVVSQK